MTRQAHALARLILALAGILALPTSAYAQVKVLMSGGFAAAYNEVLPEFERTTGTKVTTATGVSQGDGPETITSQVRRGVPVDMIILSKAGLDELIAEGRIIAGTSVDLAETPMGVAVRTGAPRPDLSTLDAFKQTLLQAKSIAYSDSTVGIFMTNTLFPRLGIAKEMAAKVTKTPRGAGSVALVAKGEVELVLLPVSELLHQPGIDVVGKFPAEAQYISVFSAAVVTGSREVEAANRLIAFLASDKAVTAFRNSGMEPSKAR